MKQLVIVLSITVIATLACSLSSKDEGNRDNPTTISQQPSPSPTFTVVPPTPTPTVRPNESNNNTGNSGNNNPPPANCTPRTDWFTYTIVRGDTLFSIAQRAGSTVNALATGNCLTDPTAISAGQTLYVPTDLSTDEEPFDNLVKVFLIIPDNNGVTGIPVGCGDSAIAVRRTPTLTGNTTTDLRASLIELFSIKTPDYGQSGFANSLYDQDVTVQSVTMQGNRAIIELTGDFLLIGTCGDARMEAQIFLTIFQYTDIQEALVTMNGTNLKQWFDMSGQTGDTDPYLRSNFGYADDL